MGLRRKDSDDKELEWAHTPLGSFRAKGYRLSDIMIALSLISIFVSPVLGFWLHTREMHQFWSALERSAQINAAAIDRQAVATRYLACINSVQQEDRWKELRQGGYCDQLSRSGAVPPEPAR